MTFYRVRYSTEGGSSAGYSWHTSRRDADRALAAAIANDPAEYADDARVRMEDRIQPVTITPTKAGILAALRQFASHEQNG